MSSQKQKPEAAYVLSLVGGVLMLVGGMLSSLWFISGASYFGGVGMMGGLGGMMGGFGFPFGMMGGLSLVGLVAGIIVIVGAVMLSSRPTERTAWGTIIIIFSAISLLGMGGFLIGAIMGIVGGALALSWNPT